MSTTDEIMGLVDRWADMCAAKTLSDGTTRHEYAAIEARVAALVAERDEARRLAGYDWNVLHAMQASLREHMQRIATLEADLNEARQNAEAYQIGVHAVVKQMEAERATFEAENRALREAGNAILHEGLDYRRWKAAKDIFTNQPGALAAWQAREVE